MSAKANQTLAQLGVGSAAGVAPLFAELRAEFDRAATFCSCRFVGRGFSRDITLGLERGALAPEVL